MKILVLSDSHSGLSFMRRCIEAVKPNAVIHLGDYYDDGTAMAEEYAGIPFYQVAGNCDRSRNIFSAAETRCEKVCGVRLYMTHGHLQKVKLGLWSLIRDAKAAGVQAVLFGHTHQPHCSREEDGLWVINPGSCGYYGGSAAVLEVRDNKIADCRMIGQSALEEMGGR